MVLLPTIPVLPGMFYDLLSLPAKRERSQTKFCSIIFDERRVLAHYERQTEEEALAEDEAAYEDRTQTAMEVPIQLVPAVRELIAKHQALQHLKAADKGKTAMLCVAQQLYFD